MGMKVQENFTVQSYETDAFNTLKPFYLQNHLQEIAYKGSEAYGISYFQLRPKNLFWAIDRIHLKINELPRWREEVCLQTWSRGKNGPLWLRNYRMFRPGKEESPLMLGTSVWTVLNLGSRAISSDDLGVKESDHVPEDTLGTCRKIVFPKGTEFKPVLSHRVSYSELDSNMHANNCFYTQWAMDALDSGFLMENSLTDLQLSYHRELRNGQDVQLLLGEEGAAGRFIKGMADGELCFSAAMQFIPKPKR